MYHGLSYLILEEDGRIQTRHHLFINFQAAYDSIARVKLYDAMITIGIPVKLIRLVRLTMTNITCQVKLDGKHSVPFATTKGLRQGYGLTCLLFNLELERIIGEFGNHRLI